MSRGSNQSDELSPLETFEPAVFLEDDPSCRGVCGFVLALATIYEDFKDIILADQLIQADRPNGKPGYSTGWGQYNGFQAYLRRLLAGLFHELFRLIESHQPVLTDPAFVATVKRMDKDARDAWGALVDAALSRTSENALARVLAIVRNKVIFHYEPDEILRGYASKFSGEGRSSRPYVSRGIAMGTTRFYFADAAAESYFRKLVDDGGLAEEFGPRSELMAMVNIALWTLVLSFVPSRGYAWRQSSTGT